MFEGPSPRPPKIYTLRWVLQRFVGKLLDKSGFRTLIADISTDGK